jgi:hypothetical protein
LLIRGIDGRETPRRAALRELRRNLRTPLWASSIRKRSSSSIAVSPKCHDKRVGRRHGEEALGVARRLSHQSKSLVEIGIVWNPDRLAGG